MAPQKCNYLVFSKDLSSKTDLNLNIKLLGTKIEKCEVPTFLGIRFDKYLNFSNQTKYLQEACCMHEST